MKRTFIIIFFLAFTTAASIAECKTKISVFLLKPTGGKEAEDLSKGIQEIMLSQLMEKDSIIPVSSSNTPSDDKDAAAKALKEGSDYAITGGVAALGKSSNISVRLIESKSAAPVQATSKLASKQEEIPEILGQITKSIKSAISSASSIAPSDASTSAVIQQTQSGTSLLPRTTSDSKKDEIPLVDSTETNLIFKTPEIEERIISIAGISGDKKGKGEIVALTRDQIMVYKAVKNQVERAATAEATPGYRNLRVDTIDLNGDGQDEIYLTQINSNFNTPIVTPYTLEKGKLTSSKSESGFFSATAFDKCKKIFLMQQSDDRGNNLYYGDIYQVTGKTLQNRTVFKAPKGAFLDNFITGKITEKQTDTWLIFDTYNKMALIDDKGETKWGGETKFGGSMESLEKNVESGRKGETERKFFKQRLIGFCDQNGISYILTVKNEDMANGLMTNFRKFTGGKAVIYAWSGIGLKEIWSSESISGGIHDIDLYDADGDGLKDIIFAASIESSFKSKGYIAGIKLPEKIARIIK